MRKIKKYLKIHGGELNSRKVFFYQRSSLRPLTGRWRQVISDKFNDLDGKNVADLFAGSGIWGISMLSNRAKHVVFFEKDTASQRIIRENLINLKVSQDRYSMVYGSLPKSLEESGLSFDLICCDPPFKNLDLGSEVLRSSQNLVKKHTTLVCRWPNKISLPKLYNLDLVQKIEHGNESLNFFNFKNG
ncbi:hypothetical protein CL643_02350 [bacterium]|nr:hypothetical protein [bacterium]